MTSFRDFDHDKDWSYLRPAAGKSWLHFESQGDDSYELVVPVEWPTRVCLFVTLYPNGVR